MRHLPVMRNNLPVGVALLVLSLFGYSLASERQEDQFGDTRMTVPEQSAIARVNGRTLTVFPKGSKPQSRELGDEYLFASPGSKGISIAGWGFVRPSSDRPGRAVAQIIASLNYGRDRESIEGFRRPSFVSISPDSKRLAIIADNKVTQFRGLQVVEFRGLHQAERAMQIESQVPGLDAYVAWSPDSTRLVFAVDSRIQLFDTETGERKFLVSGALPSWSADGRLLAFFPTDSHLSIMDMDTRHSTLISSSHRPTSRASWAPDSHRFVVEQDWGGKDRNRNCATNSRLVEYRWPSLEAEPVLDPCGLKPELFFWVDDWQQWIRN
jgi:dipeptidyl aminopeptidase/acylaminoacyl peptidase